MLGHKVRLKCNWKIAARRARRAVSRPIERALGHKARLKYNEAIVVDAHQLRNAEYRVSGPKNRESAWPQG